MIESLLIGSKKLKRNGLTLVYNPVDYERALTVSSGSTFKMLGTDAEGNILFNYTSGTTYYELAAFTREVLIYDVVASDQVQNEYISISGSHCEVKDWDNCEVNSLRIGGRLLEKVPNALWPKCTRTDAMFGNAEIFNQDVSVWDYSNITTTENMFSNCYAFNQSFSGKTFPAALRVVNMFNNCRALNKPMNDLSFPVAQTISGFLSECHAFDQPVNNWSAPVATSAGYLFAGCRSLNSPITNIHIPNSTDVRYMFENCYAFNQSLRGIGFTNVVQFGGLLRGCSSFNQPMDWLDVSKAKDIANVFYKCTVFNQNLGSWNVYNVDDCRGIFTDCVVFNGIVSTWRFRDRTGEDFSSRTMPYFNGAFTGANSFNQDLSGWIVPYGTNTSIGRPASWTLPKPIERPLT